MTALSFCLLSSVFCLLSSELPAQQPQAQGGQPVFAANAKYVQGVGPGYWPTAGSGLVLNITAGTSVCGSPPAKTTYAGGTLTMTASNTNYVYLDPTASCAPAANTAGFSAGQIPLAVVVASSSSITSITDLRTWSKPEPCAVSSAGAVNCSALGTDQNLTLAPSGFGTVVAAHFNNTVFVDGVIYPFTRAGIQSAINDAGAYGTVMLSINAPLTLDGTALTISNPGVTIVGGDGAGSGQAQTILQSPASNGDIFVVSASLFSIRNVQFKFAALSADRTGAVFNMSSTSAQESVFENLSFAGDNTYSAGDIFNFASSSAGAGISTVSKLLIVGRWNTLLTIGCSASGSTAGSIHFAEVITTVSASFKTAEFNFDGGVDTAEVDNSELSNNGLAPVIWLHNTNSNLINPRWIFFDHVLAEDFAGSNYGVIARLDAGRSFKYLNGYFASSQNAATVGASMIDTDISHNVAVSIQQSAVTIAAGAVSTRVIGNDFQDVGTATNNTYPAISVAAGTNYFTIAENRLEKVSAANLPSNFLTVASGASGQFIVANNIVGISGTDYAGTNALSISTSSPAFTTIGNTPGEWLHVLYGGSTTYANFVTAGGVEGARLDTSGNFSVAGVLQLKGIDGAASYIQFTGTPSGQRQWQFQDTSDTAVGRATTDTLTNKTLTSPALTTPTIGGETVSAAPRGVYQAFLPGALTATWTGATLTLDKAITVTRLQAQAKTAPSGCSTSAVVQLSDGTTPKTVTVTAAANDSGAITQNYAAAAVLTIGVSTAASGCSTSPADVNVEVEYKMQ